MFDRANKRGYTDILFLLLATLFAIMITGGFVIANDNPQASNNTIVLSPAPFTMHKSLQLDFFGFITAVPPTPIPAPSPQPQCNNSGINQETENYTASVYTNGQLKAWACDENTPFLAPGARVNNTTGQITNTDNTTAKDGHGNIYAPRIYLDNLISNIHPKLQYA